MPKNFPIPIMSAVKWKSTKASTDFVFNEENFRKPALPAGLNILDVPLVMATPETLQGFGKLISSEGELTTEKKNFG